MDFFKTIIKKKRQHYYYVNQRTRQPKLLYPHIRYFSTLLKRNPVKEGNEGNRLKYKQHMTVLPLQSALTGYTDLYGLLLGQ